MAIGLTKPGKPLFAEELAAIYRDEGATIFDRSLVKRVRSLDGIADERYHEGPLEEILNRLLGSAQLKNTRRDLIITAYDIEQQTGYLFKSRQARLDPRRNHLLRDVARATSAAPTYFEPLLMDSGRWSDEVERRVLIDGGVFANNPTMIALSEALASGASRGEILLCSLGTGQHSHSFHYGQAKDWGMLEWARPVISVMMDGMSDSADYYATQLLSDLYPASGTASQRYFRFDISLPDEMDALDNTSEENIRGLEQKAHETLRQKRAGFDRLIRQLAPPPD